MYKEIALITFTLCFSIGVGKSQELTVWKEKPLHEGVQDWLISSGHEKAQVMRSADGKDIILYNGLVRRTFRVKPNLTCIDYLNLCNGRQLLRSVREEARVVINGMGYTIGGMTPPKEKAYLLSPWLDTLRTQEPVFKYVSYELTPIKPLLNWKSRFWSMPVEKASGIQISFLFRAEASQLNNVEIRVNYELYDGLPLLVKSLSLTNNSSKTIVLNRVVNEVLAVVEEEGAGFANGSLMKKPSGIYIETNYAFNNAFSYPYSDQTTHWTTDTTYTSQVSGSPTILEVYPPAVTALGVKAGETFNSVRTHELLLGDYNREQRGLAIRKMYPVVAPWVMENPIFMHLVARNDEQVRTAIDQCAATGYEALILSFGSYLNMEDSSFANLRKWRAFADYAHQKGVKIGCYSLFSSRSISAEDDVIDPKTGKPNTHALFLKAPCFGSRWGLWYRDNIKRFFTATGFDIWENDGPYPGDVCASTTHPGHTGLGDSQWKQLEIQKELYHWLNERGIYINSPDWYFLDGTNKIAMGYKESNFKLPRATQKILNRQNIFDATWEKTPSMGWGFVPLTEYGGGGPESVIEPLHEHIKDYEQLMMQYYGAGVQACYRGPRLYDTEDTRKMVVKVISWYKKYRKILNSDIIHLRRADGRDWDGILHVNSSLQQKGLLMLYNPTDKKIVRTIKVPLYYTGLKDVADIREKEGAIKKIKLNRDYSIDLTFTIDPESYTWFVIAG